MDGNCVALNSLLEGIREASVPPGRKHPLAAKEMSPASRSKPKDKSAARTAKEQKSSSKASTPGNTGAGAPASAYNPLLGTFHTLETAPPVSSPPPHSNGRFRNIDETDEQLGSSVGTGAEYDSVSNNDSCSGESEDLKEKMTGTTLRQEAIPGSDNDKREKIRQKNERKHQRQRERRAQELHERCNGYLMSRKLEALAQQLVAMGFSSERATMALIANEGRIEESVAWLLEGGEEAAQQKDSSNLAGVNLKIDITEELSRILDLELKYKCSKQEVERAIVACEGDLEKASESLKTQKQEPVVSTPKTEEAGEPSAVNGGKVPAVSITQNPLRPPAKPTASITIQPRRDERDFNYTKASATVLASPESANRNLQALRRTQPKPEWSRPQVTTPPAEKRWPNSGSNPSVSYSLAPPLQAVSPAKPEAQARFVVVGSEVKNLPQGGTVREPVVMMHRPQSINAKQNNIPPAATTISASPPGTAGWYPNSVPNVEIMKSNAGLSFVPSTRNLNPSNNLTSHQFYQQPQYQPFVSSSPVDSAAAAAGWVGSGSGSGSWSTTGTQSSSSLAVPSSLGLFSGWGSSGGSGSSSPVDWSTGGSMPQCDYSNIDWTLESTAAAPSSNRNGWWLGLASLMKNSRMYDSWSLANQSAGSNPSMLMRSASPNGGGVGGVYNAGLQEGVPTMADNTSSQVASSPSSASTVGGGSGPPQHEWTSPFAGKDIFSIPRQFVTSPSL